MSQHPKDYVEAMQWAVEGKIEEEFTTGGTTEWRPTSSVNSSTLLKAYRRKPDPVVKPRELWVNIHGYTPHAAYFDCEYAKRQNPNAVPILFREVLPPVELTSEEVEKRAIEACNAAHQDCPTYYHNWEDAKPLCRESWRGIVRHFATRAPVAVKRKEWTDQECRIHMQATEKAVDVDGDYIVLLTRAIIQEWEASK